MTNRALCLSGLLWLTSVSACTGAEHIREDYGAHSRSFYARQRVYAEAAVGAPTGLDSEEAATVKATYKKNLSGGGGAATEGKSQVLVLEQGSQTAK